NVVRTVLALSRHPDHRERRILSAVACNLGPEPPALAFRLTGPKGAVVIRWEGEIGVDADQLAGEVEDAGEASARSLARRLLQLRIGDGWVRSSDVIAEAQKAGISTATLHRARAD